MPPAASDSPRPPPPDEPPLARALAAAYDELRALARGAMRGEAVGHTLQPTALAHEAWLRIRHLDAGVAGEPDALRGLAARVFRQVLVDHARARRAGRRGGGRRREPIDGVELPVEVDAAEVLAVHEAVAELESVHERAARVVELRYFGGLSGEETARALSVSLRTVHLDWAFARGWLAKHLDGGPPGGGAEG
ncbi:MAG: ECF-type sigma factor [Planctomycetota bacterium JB042]